MQTQLTGQTYGTAGSYNNGGNTIFKATDGNPNTFFDAPTASGSSVGIDLGTPMTVNQVQYAPRGGYANRMVGGVFQASADATFQTGVVTLYTVTAAPPSGSLTAVTVSPGAAYRYYRYVGPTGGGNTNIAEFQLFGPTTALQPFLVGLGSSATATPGTVGQAPVTVWVDARQVSDTRADRRRWEFGDAADVRTDPRYAVNPALFPLSTVDLNSQLTGPVAAHVYTQPGTYTIRLYVTRADGSVGFASVPVTVVADARAHYYFDSENGSDGNAGTSASSPWQTDAKFRGVAGASNTWVRVLAGSTMTVSGAIRLKSNCVIEGVADADGVKPTIKSGGSAFDGWPGQTDGAVIRGLAFGSTTVTPTTVNGAAARKGDGQAVSGRGRNIAVVDCDFGVLNLGVKFDDPTGLGVLAQGIRQTDPYGMSGPMLSDFNGGMMCWVANTGLGSLSESSTRSDGDRAAVGFAYEYNDMHQDGGVNGKALLTTRNAADAVIHGNVFDGADVGASTTLHNDGSAATLVTRVLNVGNAYVLPSDAITIKGIVDGYTFAENYIVQPPTSMPQGIQLSSSNVSNVTIKGNSGNGNTAKLNDGGTIPGLSSDIPIQR